MYESEINTAREPIGLLPTEVRQSFAEFSPRVQARTILPWGEHCTECNWPTCYTTCQLYSPRKDGGCRLFVNGMVRVDHRTAPNGYILKIQFKRWGKLWTVGNLRMLLPPEVRTRERTNIIAGAVSRSAPIPSSIKRRVLR